MKTISEIQELRERLRETIIKSSLNQFGVSVATGIAQPILSNFITGRRGLCGEYALRLDRFLNGTLAEISSGLAADSSQPVSHTTDS